MSRDPLADFRSAAYDCAAAMRRGAEYIGQELSSVDITEKQRTAIEALRNAFISNWFDIGTELRELSELDDPAHSPAVRLRVDRILDWLGECLPALNALVIDLKESTRYDAKHQGAYLLMTGSATEVLQSFTAMADARDRYLAAGEQASDGESTATAPD